MKEKELSIILKEIRYSLALSQTDMAKTLGMSLKMYSLYETGKYDGVAKGDIRRQKLLDKINIVKNKIVIASHTGTTSKPPHQNDFAYQELEKKNQELQQQVIDLQHKIIFLQEKLLIKPKKIVAQVTSKNRES